MIIPLLRDAMQPIMIYRRGNRVFAVKYEILRCAIYLPIPYENASPAKLCVSILPPDPPPPPSPSSSSTARGTARPIAILPHTIFISSLAAGKPGKHQ